jgi:hypothetical protein
MKFPWQRQDRQEELGHELQSHLQMSARNRMERGESADDAEQGARREFGNIALVERVAREQWGWPVRGVFVALRYE